MILKLSEHHDQLSNDASVVHPASKNFNQNTDKKISKTLPLTYHSKYKRYNCKPINPFSEICFNIGPIAINKH